MGRPIKTVDFNVPSTTQGHLRTLVKIIFREGKKKEKKKGGGKDQKETLEKKGEKNEVKRDLQSTLSKSGKAEWNTVQKKRRKKKKRKSTTKSPIKRSYTKCYEEQNHFNY